MLTSGPGAPPGGGPAGPGAPAAKGGAAGGKTTVGGGGTGGTTARGRRRRAGNGEGRGPRARRGLPVTVYRAEEYGCTTAIVDLRRPCHTPTTKRKSSNL